MSYLDIINHDILSEILLFLDIYEIKKLKNIFNIDNVINAKLLWINKLKLIHLDNYIKFLDLYNQLDYIDKYNKILNIHMTIISKTRIAFGYHMIFLIFNKDNYDKDKTFRFNQLPKACVYEESIELEKDRLYIEYRDYYSDIRQYYLNINNCSVIKILSYGYTSDIFEYNINERIGAASKMEIQSLLVELIFNGLDVDKLFEDCV